MEIDSLFLLLLHRCRSRSPLGCAPASMTELSLCSGSCWNQRPWPQHCGVTGVSLLKLRHEAVTRQKWCALAELYVGSSHSTDLGQQHQSLRLCLHEEHFSGTSSTGYYAGKETPSRETTIPAKPGLHEYKAAALPWAKHAKLVEACFCFVSLRVQSLAWHSTVSPRLDRRL